jgi:hypothetical protein
MAHHGLHRAIEISDISSSFFKGSCFNSVAFARQQPVCNGSSGWKPQNSFGDVLTPGIVCETFQAISTAGRRSDICASKQCARYHILAAKRSCLAGYSRKNLIILASPRRLSENDDTAQPLMAEADELSLQPH